MARAATFNEARALIESRLTAEELAGSRRSRHSAVILEAYALKISTDIGRMIPEVQDEAVRILARHRDTLFAQEEDAAHPTQAICNQGVQTQQSTKRPRPRQRTSHPAKRLEQPS